MYFWLEHWVTDRPIVSCAHCLLICGYCLWNGGKLINVFLCKSVRLAGPRSAGARNEGRLEVFHDGLWGTVCDRGFTDVAAKVACNGLGFGYAVGPYTADYSIGKMRNLAAVSTAKFGYMACLSITYHETWLHVHETSKTLNSGEVLGCISSFLRHLTNQWPCWISLRGHSRSSILVPTESVYTYSY